MQGKGRECVKERENVRLVNGVFLDLSSRNDTENCTTALGCRKMLVSEI